MQAVVPYLITNGNLDGRSLLRVSKCSKDLQKCATEDLWKKLFLEQNTGCYPVHLSTWKKAYFLLKMRIARQKPVEKPCLLRFPRDISNLIFNQLGGKDIAQLGAVSTLFYDHFNNERCWEAIFIRENNGYRPEVRSWKEAYFHQNLTKRNGRANNFHTVSLENYPLFCDRSFYQITQLRTLIGYLSGKIDTSILTNDEVYQFHSISNEHFFTAKAMDLQNKERCEIQQSWEFFILWEGSKPLKKIAERGIYRFCDDFFIHRPLQKKAPISIYSMTTLKCMLHFAEEIPDDIGEIPGKYCLALFKEKRRIKAYNSKNGRLAYEVALSDDFNPKSDFGFVTNSQFAVLANLRISPDILLVMPADQPLNQFVLSQSMYAYFTEYKLKENYLFYTIPNNPHLHGIEVLTQKNVTYSLKGFHVWRVYGNRVFFSGKNGINVLDRDTGNSLYHLDSFDVINSHVIISNYSYYFPRYMRFFNIADGSQISAIKFVEVKKISGADGDGFLYDYESHKVWDLHRPLPEKSFLQKMTNLFSFFSK